MTRLTLVDMELRTRTMADKPKRKKKWVNDGKLSAKQRQSMPRSDFALPGKGKGREGKGAGSYPIPDKSHARNALARVAQHGTPEEKAKVRNAVHRKFPNIGDRKKKMYTHDRSK